MANACLVAVLANAPSPHGEELTALPETIKWLEIRADLIGDLDADWLRNRFRGRLLYALRSRSCGGNGPGPGRERRERLLWARKRYDFVELEGEYDLHAEVLEQIPPPLRVISWYGSVANSQELTSHFRGLVGVDGQLYKLVVTASHVRDGLTPLQFLKGLRRADTVAYACGPTGSWSRLLAAHLGAPIIFGSVGDGPVPPGEFTIAQLTTDYGLPALPPVEALYGILGHTVWSSLSPRFHNAAYRALGHPALYVPFGATCFADFWQDVVLKDTLNSLGTPLRGLTVGAPHKEAALALATANSPMARRAEAANVVYWTPGAWEADTTDHAGVLQPLRERGIPLTSGPVAVIGCGGAGRAIAAALVDAGATVTVVNRGFERGRRAAHRFAVPFIPLSEFSAEKFAVVVNATPLGRNPGEVPFAVERAAPGAVVVDLVYGPDTTELVCCARASGRIAIDGREVLLVQARAQFQLMTGRYVSMGLARQALGLTSRGATDEAADRKPT